MFDILCVTDRLLLGQEDRHAFLRHMEKIVSCRPDGVILREKDLTPQQYAVLGASVMDICRKGNVMCILHSFYDAAAELSAPYIHMPMPLLRRMSDKEKACFRIIGASCHSAEEAEEAQALGCSYITAGHVFETECKKGVAPRGLAFLEEVCRRVDVPVLGIGGITEKNIRNVREVGAAGACIRSGFMETVLPHRYMIRLREGLRQSNK